MYIFKVNLQKITELIVILLKINNCIVIIYNHTKLTLIFVNNRYS